ncbi:MAG: NYN domain-containing protein [Pseudonocardiales bacterium]|nr:NYN domain-containing protein [Pseudonocardiales bacterium]
MAARRTRIFIDYWNFQLSWNSAAKQSKCDWQALPPAILTATASLLGSVGLTDPLDLEETLLYASVDPVNETNLRRWLTAYIERLPSWRVAIRERKPQPRKVHCRYCDSTFDTCPECHQIFVAKPEKGVDAAIVTDMLSLAWQNAYDIAVLVTSDADFVPVVEKIQERGLKVVNAGWTSKGHELKAACWGSFDLDPITASICR